MNEFYDDENIGYEPKINFEGEEDEFRVVVKNGSPELIDKIEAVRQWIAKFCATEKDSIPIYVNTNFGVRLKSLFGRKRLGLGYEEAELERDFREGLILCPAISRVDSVDINKVGKILKINLGIELYNGELIQFEVEKVLKIIL